MNTGLELFTLTNSDFQSPLIFERNHVFQIYEGGRLFLDFFGTDLWTAIFVRNGLHRR
jgi:hypothetical protein